jgi:hypothetical protein
MRFTYRDLMTALQALPAAALDRPVTAHFPHDSSAGAGPLIFPVYRVAPSGELLAGRPNLGMYGADLPMVTMTRGPK